MTLARYTIFAVAAVFAVPALGAGTFDAQQSNPCGTWNLSNKDLADCASAWNAAKDEDARARVRTTYELRGALAPATIVSPARPASDRADSTAPAARK